MSAEQDDEFAAFIDHEGPRLLTLAWLLTGDPDVAQELAGEALISVYLRWPRLHGTDPTAYARRCVLVPHSGGIQAAEPSAAGPALESGDDWPHRAVLRALSALNTEERAVVILRHYLDLSDPEVAAASGVAAAKVRSIDNGGLRKIRAQLDTDHPAVATERDVVVEINEAAMGAPAMHLTAASLLTLAQARLRVRRRRRVGMGLVAALVLAAVSWMAPGPDTNNALNEDVHKAERAEWDSTADFKARLPMGDGLDWPDFGDALVVRDAGEDDFSIELLGDGTTTTVAAIEGEWLEGVDAFEYGGHTLVVSEELYDSPAVLDVSSAQGIDVGPGKKLTDDHAAVQVWSVDSVLTPSQITDIYWKLPNEVVASSGDRVLSEVIAVGDREIPIYIVDSTGRWAARSGTLRDWLHTADSPEAVIPDGDVVYSVLPSGARSPELVVSGDAYDQENRLGETTRRLQPTVSIRGDYQLLWAEVESSDFIPGGLAFVDWDGAPPSWFDPGAIEVRETEAGALEITYPGTDSRLSVARGRTETQSVLGDDGSALAVAPWPAGLGGTGDPPGARGLGATLVIENGERLLTAPGNSLEGVAGDPVLAMSKLVAVAVVPGTVGSTDMKVVSTVLFQTDAGPRWAGQPVPLRHELDSGARIAVSVDRGIGVWAAGGDYAGQGLGRIGTTQVAFVESVDRRDQPTAPTLYYAVSVLPSEVASTAVPVNKGPGIDLNRVIEGKPETVDIGGGLSLWAVSLNRPPGATMGDREEALIGVDLDGDGVAD